MSAGLIKVTDPQGQGQGGVQWGPGITHTMLPHQRGRELGKPGLFHAYEDADVGLLLCGMHTTDDAGVAVWQAAGEVIVRDGLGLKAGCHTLTTVAQVGLPSWWLDLTWRRRAREGLMLRATWAVLPLLESVTGDRQARQALACVPQGELVEARRLAGRVSAHYLDGGRARRLPPCVRYVAKAVSITGAYGGQPMMPRHTYAAVRAALLAAQASGGRVVLDARTLATESIAQAAPVRRHQVVPA